MPMGTGHRAFVANFASDSVTAVDTRSLAVVGTVPAGDEARGIAVNPQGNQVGVINVFGGSITFFDPNTLTEQNTKFRSATNHGNLIYNRDGSKVIVSNSGNDTITVIDTATRTVIKTVDCHNGPFFSVFNDDETKLYVSCAGPLNPPFNPGFVDIVDTATYKVIGIRRYSYSRSMKRSSIRFDKTPARWNSLAFTSNRKFRRPRKLVGQSGVGCSA